MKITCQPKKGERIESADVDWVMLYADGRDQAGRMPTTVCTVEISHPSEANKAARFFVTIGIDSNGQPRATLTGRLPNTDSIKHARASWLDFRSRAEKAIGGAN